MSRHTLASDFERFWPWGLALATLALVVFASESTPANAPISSGSTSPEPRELIGTAITAGLALLGFLVAAATFFATNSRKYEKQFVRRLVAQLRQPTYGSALLVTVALIMSFNARLVKGEHAAALLAGLLVFCIAASVRVARTLLSAVESHLTDDTDG